LGEQQFIAMSKEVVVSLCVFVRRFLDGNKKGSVQKLL
jgi:hypothetical protein